MSAESLSQLAERFFFQRGTIHVVVDGFEPADWKLRAGEGNSAHWVLGHIASSRRSLLRALGAPADDVAWERTFARNASHGDPADFPAPEELLADIHASGKLLTERLRSMTEDEANAPLGRSMPDGGTTVADCARFLQFHEAYHIGQLGLYRRLAGKTGAI